MAIQLLANACGPYHGARWHEAVTKMAYAAGPHACRAREEALTVRFRPATTTACSAGHDTLPHAPAALHCASTRPPRSSCRRLKHGLMHALNKGCNCQKNPVLRILCIYQALHANSETKKVRWFEYHSGSGEGGDAVTFFCHSHR